MVLPRVPGKERVGFIVDMFTQMMELGTPDLTTEQLDTLKSKLQDLLNSVEPGKERETKEVCPPTAVDG